MQILKEKREAGLAVLALLVSHFRVYLPTSWLIFCTLACTKEQLLIAEFLKPYLL
jgi:hypothetical protein